MLAPNPTNLFKRKAHLIRKHPDFNTLLPAQQEHLLNYFSSRDKPPNLDIDWNKLAFYNIQSILKATYELSKTGKKKAVKKFGIKGLKDGEDYLEFPMPDPNIKAYIPLNYEASKFIAGSRIGLCEGKWCTAYQKTDEHWKTYSEQGIVLVYIIALKPTKYAIAVYKNNALEIFDAANTALPANVLNEYLKINIKTLIRRNQPVIRKARNYIAEMLAIKKRECLKYLDGLIPVPDKNTLKELINSNLDVSNLNVSHITDMRYLFQNSTFNGDISKWNVSNVTDMSYMFSHSRFNGDISKWNVSNVTDMTAMFMKSRFNGDISSWDVSNVRNMSVMFENSRFNNDISRWNVSNVKNMERMFSYSIFNSNIANWNVSNVNNMAHMFSHSRFNGDISKWNVSNVTSMSTMFAYSKFNKDISNWNVSNVQNMIYMFYSAKNFNSDISNWDISNVIDADFLFKGSPLERRYPNGLDDLKEEQRLKVHTSRDWLYEELLWQLL